MDPTLVERLLARDPRAIARALTVVTDGGVAADVLLNRVHTHTGRAYVIGVTGPPGAGKSTLVDRLITEFRLAGQSVGVLAVDPTSPFTGGAILGDRVRMQAHDSDAGVFIRSLATRGQLGGLAARTDDGVRVLDAAGFEIIIIETVGVGQDEVEVARVADVAVLVLAPGAGDDVQALKAGIMEIADIFVVNKADREGAEHAVRAIEATLALGAGRDEWQPPVLRTVATEGTGVAELVAAIERFRASSVSQRARRRPERAAPTGSAVLRLDHVAIAVEHVTEILAFLERAAGATAGPPEDVAGQSVRVRFVSTAGAALEILEPLGTASPVTRFLENRGPGLHHVAFRVRDLPGVLASLKAQGVRLIDEAPRTGAHGASIAFVHPSSTGGVLVELMAEESIR